MKDNGHKYFLSVLADVYTPVRNNFYPKSCVDFNLPVFPNPGINMRGAYSKDFVGTIFFLQKFGFASHWFKKKKNWREIFKPITWHVNHYRVVTLDSL